MRILRGHLGTMGLILAYLAAAVWYNPKEYSNPVVLYSGRHPPAWVAVDVGRIRDGSVLIGDKLYIEFVDYQHAIPTLRLPVYDVGPLNGYYADGYPIVIDIESGSWPEALEGMLSARVRVYNHSALVRLREKRGLERVR